MTERHKIGIRNVGALAPGETIWDTAVVGFGARRQTRGVSYVVKARLPSGRQVFHTIGRHGAPWTPDTARDEARRVLVDVVNGHDPGAERRAARSAKTVGELCQQYLRDAEEGRILGRNGRPKRPGTVSGDRGRIEGHIMPLIGNMLVAEVTQNDIDKLLHDIAKGKTVRQAKMGPRALSRVTGGEGAATRTVGLLGAIFTYGIRRGLRADNPVRGVQKFADNTCDRRLRDEEYAKLGQGIALRCGGIWPPAVSCILFLNLTGWRPSEALNLRWSDVDFQRRTAFLPVTKTDRSVRPLSQAACAVLAVNRPADPNGLVFPATRGDGPMGGFKRFARKTFDACGLPADVTPYVLRHSFISVAADLGYSEPTIASLVGHKGRSVTSRYIHAADTVLLAAADAVALAIARRMGVAAAAKRMGESA